MAILGGALGTDYSEITALTLHAVLDDLNAEGFCHLESDSTMTLEAIMRPNDRGGSRLVGYRVTARLNIPQNSYTLYKSIFDRIRYGEWNDLQFQYGLFDRYSGRYQQFMAKLNLSMYGGSTANVIGGGCTGFRVVTIDKRIRTEIDLEYLYSAQLFDSQTDIDDFWDGFDNT